MQTQAQTQTHEQQRIQCILTMAELNREICQTTIDPHSSQHQLCLLLQAQQQRARETCGMHSLLLTYRNTEMSTNWVGSIGGLCRSHKRWTDTHIMRAFDFWSEDFTAECVLEFKTKHAPLLLDVVAYVYVCVWVHTPEQQTAQLLQHCNKLVQPIPNDSKAL